MNSSGKHKRGNATPSPKYNRTEAGVSLKHNRSAAKVVDCNADPCTIYQQNNSINNAFNMGSLTLSIAGINSASKTLTIYSNTTDTQISQASWLIADSLFSDAPTTEGGWTAFKATYVTVGTGDNNINVDLAQWAADNGSVAGGALHSYTIETGCANSDGCRAYPISNTIEVEAAAVPAIPLPSVPQNFTAAPGDGEVTTGWSAAANATSYVIAYKLATDTLFTEVVTTNLSESIASLTNGLEYYFKVKARNVTGDSAYTAIRKVTPVSAAVAGFKFSVKSDNAGVSNNDQYLIKAGAGTFLYDVATDDGYSATGLTGAHTITFPTGAGTHNVTITGDFPLMLNDNGNDRLKILDITEWGDYGENSTNQRSAFFGCNNLIVSATDSGKFGSVTNFQRFAFFSSSLTTFPNIDLSSGTEFNSFCYFASSLTTFPANMFDSSTATDYANAFASTNLTTQSIDNILVSIVASGVSNGTFKQSGGQAPSATGLAAKDTLVADGWTVIYTT